MSFIQTGLILSCCCAFVALLGVDAQVTEVFGSAGIQPGDVPHPVLHYTGCGREKESWICDQHHILKHDEYKRIDKAIDKLAAVTDPAPCDSTVEPGYEVGVALVRKMALGRFADVERSGEQFAKIVHDNWGVGHEKCGNGILIFVSIEDRYAYISVGKAALYRLTDSRRKAALSTMFRLFKSQRYLEGLEAGLGELESYLKTDPPFIDRFMGFLTTVIMLLVVAALVFAIYEAVKEAREEGERSIARRQVRRLENDRNKLIANDYDITSCPVCLEDLDIPEATDNPDGGNDEDNVHEGHEEIQDRKNEMSSAEASVTGDTSGDSNPKPAERRNSEYYRRRLLEKLGHGPKRKSNKRRTVIETSNDNSSASGKEPFALKCGHIFCQGCISQWLEKNNTCPICRDFVVEDVTRMRNQRQIIRRRNNTPESLLWREMTYRAGRVHYYYPRYVSRSMVQEFEREPRETYLSRHAHLQRPRNTRRRTTRSGARRRNFGGGRSAGGTGGRW